MRKWPLRILAGALATLAGSALAVAATGAPAQAASCVYAGTRSNDSILFPVDVEYSDCSDGTWRIDAVNVRSQYARNDAVVVIRRYQNKTLVTSAQKRIGTMGANVRYDNVFGKVLYYNKIYNPYVYVRYQNHASENYLDSPITRLPWVTTA